MRLHSALAFALAPALALAGCPSQPEQPRFDSGPSMHDAGADGGAHLDAGSDAARDAASALDTNAVDDAGTDAASAPDASVDASMTLDASTDANVVDANVVDANVVDANRLDGGNACVNGGGRCVALVPTACPAPNHVGDATMYSCGPGVGTECCLPPAASTMPVCMNTGTAQEGWYQPDGTVICLIGCAGLTAMCQRVGTPSAGWYTTSGHGCPPHTTEIVHDDTCR